MKTRLSERFGVTPPFVGAGMAFICDMPDLCIAMTRAGGVRAPTGRTVPVSPRDAIVTVPQTTGDFDQMPMLAGQSAGLIHDVAPAGEIVARMMDEAAVTLRGLSP